MSVHGAAGHIRAVIDNDVVDFYDENDANVWSASPQEVLKQALSLHGIASDSA